MKRLLIGLFLSMTALAVTPYNERPEIASFIKEVAAKHKIEEAKVRKAVHGARYQQSIIDAMNRPYEAQPWHVYKKLVNDKRVEAGVQAWDENEEALNRAWKQYGVEPEIILAIIGIESWYGKFKGKHRVIDALATLAFDYPKRASFFKGELEHFIVLSNEQEWDLDDVKGSYAGAMGLAQFIPSSYRSYAIDFTGNGKVDLINNFDDAIGSVANYFAKHGWQSGREIIVPAKITSNDYQSRDWSLSNPKPNLTRYELNKLGVEADIGGDKGTLITLDGEKGPEHYVGLQNFYTITRYNHSSLYAMAVVELSKRIKTQRTSR